jgi:hypothetical protein
MEQFFNGIRNFQIHKKMNIIFSVLETCFVTVTPKLKNFIRNYISCIKFTHRMCNYLYLFPSAYWFELIHEQNLDVILVAYEKQIN